MSFHIHIQLFGSAYTRLLTVSCFVPSLDSSTFCFLLIFDQKKNTTGPRYVFHSFVFSVNVKKTLFQESWELTTAQKKNEKKELQVFNFMLESFVFLLYSRRACIRQLRISVDTQTAGNERFSTYSSFVSFSSNDDIFVSCNWVHYLWKSFAWKSPKTILLCVRQAGGENERRIPRISLLIILLCMKEQARHKNVDEDSEKAE